MDRDQRPVGTLTMDELFEEIQSRSNAAVVLLGMDRVIGKFVEDACLRVRTEER